MRGKFFLILGIIPLLLLIYLSGSNLNKDILSGDRINILLTGTSLVENRERPISFTLLSYEPVTGYLDLLIIPSDAMLSVPYEITWRQVQRLDDIYLRFKRDAEGAVENFHQVFFEKLEKYLGDRLSINYYFTFDYSIVKDIVGKLGGIEVKLEEEGSYSNTRTGFSLHYSTGTHYFSGQEAGLFAGAVVSERDERSQKTHFGNFLSGILGQSLSLEGIRLLPSLPEIFGGRISTNLKLRDILVIFESLRDLSDLKYRRQALVGPVETRWGINYRNIDRDKKSDIIDVIYNSALLNLPVSRRDKVVLAEKRITAEVWNATSKSGLAREMTEFLRRRNVDVIGYGNYGAKRRMTQVISRNGDLRKAVDVSKIIGCMNVVTDIDIARMVDVNVVIGDDIEEIWSR